VIFLDRSDFGLASVIIFVEEVLKITDNGAAVEKIIYLYLTIHLLLVNHNVPMHLFGPKCNIKFIYNIQLFSSRRNKSVALSNEALIKRNDGENFG